MMVGELTLGNVKLGEDIFNYYIKEIRNEPIIWNTFIHNLLARDEKLADFILKNEARFSSSTILHLLFHVTTL